MFYVNMVFSLIDKYCKKTKFYSIILLLRVIISNVNIFKKKTCTHFPKSNTLRFRGQILILQDNEHYKYITRIAYYVCIHP